MAFISVLLQIFWQNFYRNGGVFYQPYEFCPNHWMTDFDWWHATFTVFWLNIALIAVHSGERCGPWASGFLYALVIGAWPLWGWGWRGLSGAEVPCFELIIVPAVPCWKLGLLIPCPNWPEQFNIYLPGFGLGFCRTLTIKNVPAVLGIYPGFAYRKVKIPAIHWPHRGSGYKWLVHY